MKQNKFRNEYNVFNSKYALCVSEGQNEGKTAWVLNFQMAPKKNDSANYNWDHDIRIQLTESEICDFSACIIGRRDEFKAIRAYGGGNKYFNLNKDSKGIVTLSIKGDVEKQQAMMVRLNDADRLKLYIYAFRCLMKNNGGVSQEVLFHMHDRIYV